MKCYLLDACAILAFLKTEPGYERVAECFEEVDAGQASMHVHASTLYEVYYQYLRDEGVELAQATWQDVTTMPVQMHYTFDEAFLQQAAEFKARHRMSVADSFLLAQAKRLNASVITSDHHEFDAVEQAGLGQFTWMR
jgi:predicted nucleic acid-binding protein